MAIYAIGDIQGCYDELKHLLKKINFNQDKDRLWFTGDLVNRGPNSLETLRFIQSLGENAIVVLGNHDLHLLATAFYHNKPGRKDTIHDVLQAPDRKSLLNWLRHLPLIHNDDAIGITMIHAGIHPDWSIDKTMALAKEVEQVLQSDKHIGFYQHMYGDKPAYWSEGLNGWPRYRYITNILTRLRYCNTRGAIALNAKGPPGSQAEGMQPWFEITNRVSCNDPIIFGHWSTLALTNRIYNNVYPLDTGCLWGGKLTALRIDEKPFQTLQISCKGTQKPVPGNY